MTVTGRQLLVTIAKTTNTGTPPLDITSMIFYLHGMNHKLLNKCSDRSMKMLLPALLGIYDRQADQKYITNDYDQLLGFSVMCVSMIQPGKL